MAGELMSDYVRRINRQTRKHIHCVHNFRIHVMYVFKWTVEKSMCIRRSWRSGTLISHHSFTSLSSYRLPTEFECSINILISSFGEVLLCISAYWWQPSDSAYISGRNKYICFHGNNCSSSTRKTSRSLSRWIRADLVKLAWSREHIHYHIGKRQGNSNSFFTRSKVKHLFNVIAYSV